MSERKQSLNPIILILLLILLIFIFLSNNPKIQSELPLRNSNLTMLLGFLGFLLIFLTLLRLLSRIPSQPKKTTLTVIQCTKCAFKSIRNFQVGDYIPKVVGTCPSCGGPFQIEAIYVEEKSPKKKSFEPF